MMSDDEERKRAEQVAREWLQREGWNGSEFNDMAPGPLADLIVSERSAARELSLEVAACACERARPHGGRAWSEGPAACFEALTHVAEYIRAMKARLP